MALACGVLWLSSVFGAGAGLSEGALAALGALGVLVAIVLLVLIDRQHRRLAALAATDALTGLPNHRDFHEKLELDLGRARRQEIPLAVVAIDLDSFKEINDTHGHPYGDEVLRRVGLALEQTLEDGARAARIGGEEFALILPGADPDRAFVLAERAREAVGTIAVHGFELSCSAGIASFPGDAEDPSGLLGLADTALYWAKRSGKNRTRRFDPDRAPTQWSGRQQAEVEALLALERPAVPYFQPVVSLASGRIVGYEALARFPSSPNRAPDMWFAQAHGCGLGAELEAAAIRAALESTARPLGTHLAVNVSPSALATNVVQDAFKGDLHGIVVEITEHEFVPDDAVLNAVLDDLRERGALIAIDDAGAGHAGLTQLMALRPDIVKLDRTLVHEVQGDRARMALIESFVRFARDVDATVCAEGIESLDELAALADLDVQWGQGYALARPAPPWAHVSPVAAEVCRASVAENLGALPPVDHTLGSSDRRLVHVSARLAGARTRRDLNESLALIAQELGAAQIVLSAWYPHRAELEILAENGEPSAQTVFDVDEYPLTARVVREQTAAQVFVGDPKSDPAEVALLLRLGLRSLLMVPIVSGGECLGIVEAYGATERPWSRAEINRARVVANQFASVIPNFVDAEDDERSRR